VSSDLQISFGS